MKSVLLSITPEWVAKILNGEKTIEVRKKFPADYVGWVYIYCTKDSKTKLSSNSLQYYVIDNKDYKDYLGNWNGKVVARFWCDKIEKITYDWNSLLYETDSLCQGDLSGDSCVPYWKMSGYLGMRNGYAIFISKLEIFDKPRELNEFGYYESDETMPHRQVIKAPQNYCYIEGDK